MSFSKPISTPTASHIKLLAHQCPSNEVEKEYLKNIPYANVAGSITYAMICLRPDLSFASSLVSRYMPNPSKAHWTIAKWMLRYLKGTADVGLCYRKFEGSDDKLIRHSDSDIFLWGFR